MDLQADLQVRTDLQSDLQVQTGLGATQISPLVSFQAETSTEREKPRIWKRSNPSLMLPDQCTSMGGTCEQRRLSPGSRRLTQGPNHVIGELPIKSSARRKFGSAYSNLQNLHRSTRIYHLHRSTRIYSLHTWSTPIHRGNLQDSPHHRHTPKQHPGNALTPWSIQPSQWAIWLHHHYMEKEHFLRCKSSFSSSCSKISTIPTINGIVLQCPTMCVIVTTPGTQWGRTFVLSVYWKLWIMKCFRQLWLFLFRQLTVWRSLQGFSYGAVCEIN